MMSRHLAPWLTWFVIYYKISTSDDNILGHQQTNEMYQFVVKCERRWDELEMWICRAQSRDQSRWTCQPIQCFASSIQSSRRGPNTVQYQTAAADQ